jgi:hypothetical protein
VVWKGTADNLFVTLINRTTNLVVWRGSYVSEPLFQEFAQSEGGIALASLSQIDLCKSYLWDIYDDTGSPRRRRLEVISSGYSR